MNAAHDEKLAEATRLTLQRYGPGSALRFKSEGENEQWWILDKNHALRLAYKTLDEVIAALKPPALELEEAKTADPASNGPDLTNRLVRKAEGLLSGKAVAREFHVANGWLSQAHTLHGLKVTHLKTRESGTTRKRVYVKRADLEAYFAEHGYPRGSHRRPSRNPSGGRHQSRRGPVIPPPEGMLTVAQAAERLGVSESWIHARLGAGDIKGDKAYYTDSIGRRQQKWFVDPVGLELEKIRRREQKARGLAKGRKVGSKNLVPGARAKQAVVTLSEPNPRWGSLNLPEALADRIEEVRHAHPYFDFDRFMADAIEKVLDQLLGQKG